MYQDYFGFKRMPFHVTPDPDLLYLSPTHQEALAYLEYGIYEKKGFILLTGEVGCGKTTLCRKLIQKLEPHTSQIALILNPLLSPQELLTTLYRDLVGEDPQPNTDITHALQSLLLQHSLNKTPVVIIIDEAQNLPVESFEALRLLSNLETHSEKLLQILLVGQPELRTKLQHPQLRQLKQRILVNCDLSQLNYSQTRRYILHRLHHSGAHTLPHFSFFATRKIYRFSQGIPRIINNLCDLALLSAYSQSSHRITLRDVLRAKKELQI